eukprot:CAMPEP_0178917658 /NCGR_PEP_ID=MMETSP0786-20121207/13369_1 /TAXON_ID=186022 /ORGANISM="Thalassionema frauenfeldii, Strain CCMP 1798" /LENGTH=601 /DNA_ID=CAMNT_0020591233 /DNA_START=44 /DNA_END=1849 /DNA_ORIENTATION=+
MSHRFQTIFSFFVLAFAAVQRCVLGGESLTDPSSSAYEEYSNFVSTVPYPNQKFMGNNDEVSVFWEVDLESDRLNLVVAAAAQGWVGFGISDTGAMKGADMVIFEAATKELNDYYSMDYVRPELDDCPSDWTMTRSVVTDSFIAFEASRLIDTKDDQDIRIRDDSGVYISPTIVIAAWGDSPNLAFHGKNRAVRSALRFYQQANPIDVSRSDVVESGKSNQDILTESADESVKFTVDNFTVPLKTSHYKLKCVNIADLPGISQNETINVIGFAHSPSIDNNGVDTTGFVHHYIAMGLPGECAADVANNNPLKKVLYIWAPGQDPMLFPPKVSYPLGSDTQLKSLLLEIHYSNLNSVEDVVDDTGIVMFYMKEPREFDAQVMVLGSAPGAFGIDGTVIPEGTSRHENACPEECFSWHFPKPVTVFAEGFHMHYNGVRITGQLKRDGTEIVNDASVEVWDYDQNGVRLVQQEPYEILPGRDSYTYACYFDTDDNTTLFGQDTTQEMCVAILWYYPATNDPFLPQYCGPNFVFPKCRTNYTPIMVDKNAERVFGTHDGICPSKPEGNEPITGNPTMPDTSSASLKRLSGIFEMLLVALAISVAV